MLCIYYCCQQMPLNNGDLASSLPALMSVMMNEEQPGHIVLCVFNVLGQQQAFCSHLFLHM